MASASPMRYTGLPPRQAEAVALREAEERQSSPMRYGTIDPATTGVQPPGREDQPSLRGPAPSLRATTSSLFSAGSLPRTDAPAALPETQEFAQPRSKAPLLPPPRYNDEDDPANFDGAIASAAKGKVATGAVLLCSNLCADFCRFFVLLASIPCLIFFVYHRVPATVVASLGLLYIGALAPLCGTRGNVLAAALTTSCILTTFASLYSYYAYVQPLQSLQAGRTYSGVYLEESALAFSDAAVLRFARNASVDVQRSVGWRSVEGGVHDFCVAPVTDNKASFAGQPQYWAIGLDCCRAAVGTFDCGDVADRSVHGGVVLHDPGRADLLYDSIGEHFVPQHRRRDQYLKAIARAVVVHNLTMPQNVSLMFWSSSTRGDAIQAKRLSVALVLLGQSIVITIVAATLTLLLAAFKASEFAIGVADNLREGQRTEALPSVTAFIDQVIEQGADGGNTRKELSTFACSWAVLILSVIMWTWMPCLTSGPVLLVLFLAGVCGIVVALLMAPHGAVHGVLACFMAVVGAYIGWGNYVHNTFYYTGVSGHRRYTDVHPEADAAMYIDAGAVFFHHSATLGLKQALGYLYRGVTYCVAPIVEANATHDPGRADFWAVGTNCCDARGSFRCYRAGEENGRAGVVLPSTDPPDMLFEENTLREIYLKAVNAAGATHVLSTTNATEPILLHWGHDVDGLQQRWLDNSIGTIIVTALVSLLVLAVMASVTIFFAAQHHWRRVRTLEWINSEANKAFLLAGNADSPADEDPDSRQPEQQQPQRQPRRWVQFDWQQGFEGQGSAS